MRFLLFVWMFVGFVVLGLGWAVIDVSWWWVIWLIRLNVCGGFCLSRFVDVFTWGILWLW